MRGGEGNGGEGRGEEEDERRGEEEDGTQGPRKLNPTVAQSPSHPMSQEGAPPPHCQLM